MAIVASFGPAWLRRPTIDPNSLTFTILLGLLAALPALSIDISAPTLALLPAALNTSTMVAGLTLSMFMGGFAVGQLAGGDLSDRRGRKPVLLAGFVIYSLAGAACAVASTGPALVASRFVQGLGAGTCAVLSFAMVQDLFEGAAARSKRAYVTVILGGVPILAPALGSVVSDFIGWRAVHGLLAVAGIVLLVIVWLWLAESRRPQPPRPASAASAAPAGANRLWHDTRFVNLALVNALSYGAVFAYIAGSPILVVDYYGGSSRSFATVFAGTALALTVGAWTGGRLGRRGMSAETLLRAALAASAASSLALALVCMADPAVSGPAAIPLLLIILFSRGIISPNLQHLAIDRQRDRAGVASAAVGVSQLSFGALSSAVVAALLSGYGPFAVGVPMMMFSAAALALWLWIMRNERA